MLKKNKKWLIAGASVLLIGVAWLIFRDKGPTEEYSTVVATSGPLKQTVSEVGVLTPVQELSLNFLGTGRIDDIFVTVGDEVETGAYLASLETDSLVLKKVEAQAGLNIAQANLSKLLAGASSETVRVSMAEVEQAKASEASAKADLEQTKRTVAENISQAEKLLNDLTSTAPETTTPQEQAVVSASVALENALASGLASINNSKNTVLITLNDKILTGEVALDNLNTILEDDDAKNILGVKNTVTLSNTKNARTAALNLIPSLKAAISKAQTSGNLHDINEAGNLTKEFLLKTSSALNNAYAMLEATIITADFSQAKLDSYKTLVTTQNSQVSAALNSVEGALQAYNNALVAYDTSVASAQENLRQAQVALENAITNARNSVKNITLSGEQQITAAQSRYENAKNTVALAQARLNSVKAPARSQDILLAQAQVSQARAALDNIDNQILNSIITAPLGGIITEINYNVGEQFGTSPEPAIKMLADNNFIIEVDISESDINKISINDPVDITLDAFPDDLVFSGNVSFIEPAQTLIQGVVYYKVEVTFSDLAQIQETLASQDLSLKSGMTANVVITTEVKENVISVPARAIITEDDRKFVRLLVNGEPLEVPVTTGIRGDNGLMEIKEGLTTGDEVITFVKPLN